MSQWAQPLMAQPPRGEFNKDEAKSLKVGIYTRVLRLTPAEAEKFWPIFNELEEKREAIMDQERDIRDQVEANFSEMDDAELEKLIDRMMALRKEEVLLAEEYYLKYKKILPIRKVALIHRAEMMYKRTLLERMRGREHDR